MHNRNLIIAGKNLAEFSCWWDGAQVYRRPAKQIQKLEVPGRSGDLIVNYDRLENVIIPFNCFIKENYRENFHALMDYLNNLEGYVELRTTEEPNCYREVLFHAAVEPTMTPFNQAGQFTLEFDCKPQLWMDEGQRIYNTENGTGHFFNNTFSKAYPIYIITGTGTLGVYTGEWGSEIYRGGLEITSNPGTIYLEALPEGVDAYAIDSEGNITNANRYINYLKAQEKRDFRFWPGLNTVYADEDLKVKPRWHRL